MHEAQEATLVTIGIDPHKRTHTAVAVDEHRQQLGELQVVASPAMTRTLLRWASAWPARRWAIEGSDGLGRLLARQLVAARETVVDVPPTLASQVRLLRTGHGRKTDRLDALSVAEIAASRGDLRQVVSDGETTVLRLLADRRDELSQQRRQAVNRLHRHLRDLVPGGAPTALTADGAAQVLSRLRPRDPVAIERKHVARQLIAEIRRLDKELKDNRQRTCEVVEACGTTLTDVFGISYVLAAKILGHTGPIGRFATADAFASYTGTAPIEVSSGDAVRHRLSRAGNRKRHCRRLRQLHRHSPDRGIQRRCRQTPAVACQHRTAPGGPRAAHAPRPRARLLSPQDRRGEESQGGHALPETTTRQGHLPPAP